MEDLEKFERLNMWADGFMNDNNGDLKDLKVCVKISPSIDHYVSAVCFLSFHEEDWNYHILCDRNFNIQASNRNFKTLLDSAGVTSTENKPANFGKMCKSFQQAA